VTRGSEVEEQLNKLLNVDLDQSHPYKKLLSAATSEGIDKKDKNKIIEASKKNFSPIEVKKLLNQEGFSPKTIEKLKELEKNFSGEDVRKINQLKDLLAQNKVMKNFKSKEEIDKKFSSFLDEFWKKNPPKSRVIDENENYNIWIKLKNEIEKDEAMKVLANLPENGAYKKSYDGSIFVLTPDGDVILGRHKDIGHFHHSSLNGGKDVLFAGSIKTDGNTRKIKYISDSSGHYKTPVKNFVNLLDQFIPNGLDFENVEFEISYPPQECVYQVVQEQSKKIDNKKENKGKKIKEKVAEYI
jgi:hypothetical protein